MYMKDAECAEKIGNVYSDFYFMSYGRFCAQNVQKIDHDNTKSDQKNVVPQKWPYLRERSVMWSNK